MFHICSHSRPEGDRCLSAFVEAVPAAPARDRSVGAGARGVANASRRRRREGRSGAAIRSRGPVRRRHCFASLAMAGFRRRPGLGGAGANRPENPLQQLEKIGSAPGNGCVRRRSHPQDLALPRAMAVPPRRGEPRARMRESRRPRAGLGGAASRPQNSPQGIEKIDSAPGARAICWRSRRPTNRSSPIPRASNRAARSTPTRAASPPTPQREDFEAPFSSRVRRGGPQRFRRPRRGLDRGRAGRSRQGAAARSVRLPWKLAARVSASAEDAGSVPRGA